MLEPLCPLVFFCVVSGCIGTAIGHLRNSGGFWLGFFLGPIGWLLAFLNDGRPQCPACASRFNPGARICPTCRTSLVAPARPVEVEKKAEEAEPGAVAQQFRSEFPVPRQLPKPPPPAISLPQPPPSLPIPPPVVLKTKPKSWLPSFVWTSLAVAAFFLSAAICLIVVVRLWPQSNRESPIVAPVQGPIAETHKSSQPTRVTPPEAKPQVAPQVVTEPPITPPGLAEEREARDSEHTQWRTWTDTHGHKIEAQWQGMTAGIVKLVTKDGNVLKIPRQQFSKEDQKWISERGSPFDR